MPLCHNGICRNTTMIGAKHVHTRCAVPRIEAPTTYSVWPHRESLKIFHKSAQALSSLVQQHHRERSARRTLLKPTHTATDICEATHYQARRTVTSAHAQLCAGICTIFNWKYSFLDMYGTFQNHAPLTYINTHGAENKNMKLWCVSQSDHENTTPKNIICIDDGNGKTTRKSDMN